MNTMRAFPQKIQGTFFKNKKSWEDSLIVLLKRVRNTCYKIVVRKLPMTKED